MFPEYPNSSLFFHPLLMCIRNQILQKRDNRAFLKSLFPINITSFISPSFPSSSSTSSYSYSPPSCYLQNLQDFTSSQNGTEYKGNWYKTLVIWGQSTKKVGIKEEINKVAFWGPHRYGDECSLSQIANTEMYKIVMMRRIVMKE